MKDRSRSMRRMHLQALALLLAAAVLPACSPEQGGGTPTATTAAPTTSDTGSPAPSPGSPSPDAETTVPAPAPEPSAAPSGPGQGNAELAISIIPAEGEEEISYTLVCTDGVPAAESVHPDADAACAALKENAGLVSPATPGTDQACTQQYGGPQKATVNGVVDGIPVEASFSRTDGCEISSWDAAKDVLGEAGGA
ncbi:SSI family serine proteinase inhibitor [Pseudarthrobacter sp. NamE5]|uniref:SSI family serine proteinase inhibitor n=1 Tax=Pseudarthrobacter sp. NamE5 TaxID=2576839 RepID=UPI001F10932F|nr:SSI family serine proteinase inhibitor [Pseudarthrobacter sp. NamE5]